MIDLFAGPGGLGEGFVSRVDRDGKRVFKIALSIEMNEAARTTLRLRSFFRQFDGLRVPDEYYELLEGKLTLAELYEKFPKQAAASDREAWQAELGNTSTAEIDQRIKTAIQATPQWVLIGGPPCQAYSMAGRSRVINVNREKYEKDRRHFLYQEYLRILRVHRPPIFVMENVKGILSSKMEGKLIVEKILTDLESPLADDPECEGAHRTARVQPLSAHRLQRVPAFRGYQSGRPRTTSSVRSFTGYLRLGTDSLCSVCVTISIGSPRSFAISANPSRFGRPSGIFRASGAACREREVLPKKMIRRPSGHPQSEKFIGSN